LATKSIKLIFGELPRLESNTSTKANDYAALLTLQGMHSAVIWESFSPGGRYT
jgi:hypothetical protein